MFSGCRASPGGPVWWGRRGFTRQPERPNVHISGHLRFKTPPKFNEKTPRERQKERNGGGKGKKKSEILGGPAEGVVQGSPNQQQPQQPQPQQRQTQNKWGPEGPARWDNTQQHTTTQQQHNNTQHNNTQHNNTKQQHKTTTQNNNTTTTTTPENFAKTLKHQNWPKSVWPKSVKTTIGQNRSKNWPKSVWPKSAMTLRAASDANPT